ncbi:MAG: lamin tail domain-containing protein, partial [Clostridia bacterium]|nr:lamin tail domain-containing protein [Clostridia bacterium]
MNSDMQYKSTQRNQTRVASRLAPQSSARRPYSEGTPSSGRAPSESSRRGGSQQRQTGSRPAKKTVSVRPGSNGIWIIALGVICIVALIVYLTRGGRTSAQPVSHGVTISEVMMSNSGTVPDETGNFPDWIELHNTTGDTIEVGGFGLSDDKLGTVKWTIPMGTRIEPNGYLIIYCSGDPSRGPMHASFKLSSSDVVTLSTEAGTIVEQIQLKPVASGKTFARNGSGEFEEMNPSPGQSNDSAGQQKFLETISAVSNENVGVFINEFMASNASTIMGPDGTYCDWIELYNVTNQPVDLSGYGISDTASQPLKYVFPHGTTIPAQGVLLIYCTGKEGTDPVTIEVPFGLRSYKEEVVLATPQGKILDSVSYEKQETDVSTMRSPDGTGPWQST